jgi:hypothetical protein
VPRTARVVAFWHQRRARAVCCRRPLHCRIVRRTTRQARSLLCQGLVPRAARPVALRLQRRARAFCRRRPLHCVILRCAIRRNSNSN